MTKYFSTHNNHSERIILTLSFLSSTRQLAYLLFTIHFQYHKSSEARNVIDNSGTRPSLIKLFEPSKSCRYFALTWTSETRHWIVINREWNSLTLEANAPRAVSRETDSPLPFKQPLPSPTWNPLQKLLLSQKVALNALIVLHLHLEARWASRRSWNLFGSRFDHRRGCCALLTKHCAEERDCRSVRVISIREPIRKIVITRVGAQESTKDSNRERPSLLCLGIPTLFWFVWFEGKQTPGKTLSSLFVIFDWT